MPGKNDIRLLQYLQNDFPVSLSPFADIASRFGLSEAEVMRKVKAWQRRKVIRYIGAIFDNRKLGICSTLVAMRVPASKLRRASALISAYPQVTHNYLRDGSYNLWFTLSAASRPALKKLLRRIIRKTGISEVLNLETKKVFKIDARFSFPKL